MTHRERAGVLAIAAVLIAGTATAQWSDRTELEFSAPVMVPGATLPAGMYVFELADTGSSRHLVLVRDENNRIVATAQAVPMRRPMPNEDLVLQFNPTEPGAAPAIRGWFSPGSLHGHEFVYPEEQARQIAQRTKTIVLGIDVPGTDLEKGTLRQFSASGDPTPWRGDPDTIREWNTWRQQARRTSEPDERRQGTAPAVRAEFEGTRVELEDLEEQPAKYTGQQISVDGVVEEVHGPRLFTIDEPRWGDLDGEILVLMRTPLAAAVRENDRVSISGTMRPFVRTEIEREWGWLGLDPDIEVEVGAKPILVAERLVGGNNNVAMVIDTTPRADRVVGTSGGAGVADAAVVATGDERLVGRSARFAGVRVDRVDADGGFFVDAGTHHVFVLPAQAAPGIRAGDTVTVDGVILQLPFDMIERLNVPQEFNDDIYVYATGVAER